MPDRHNSTPDYRYGFQGQERDDEVKGAGNSVNYKYRMHDPRLGRFFAVDPITKQYPELTPYQFSSNSPIAMIELEGLEGITYLKRDRVETRDGEENHFTEITPIYGSNYGGYGNEGVLYRHIDNDGNKVKPDQFIEADHGAFYDRTAEREALKLVNDLNYQISRMNQKIADYNWDNSWWGSFHNEYMTEYAFEGDLNKTLKFGAGVWAVMLSGGTVAIEGVTVMGIIDVGLAVDGFLSTENVGSPLQVGLSKVGISREYSGMLLALYGYGRLNLSSADLLIGGMSKGRTVATSADVILGIRESIDYIMSSGDPFNKKAKAKAENSNLLDKVNELEQSLLELQK